MCGPLAHYLCSRHAASNTGAESGIKGLGTELFAQLVLETRVMQDEMTALTSKVMLLSLRLDKEVHARGQLEVRCRSLEEEVVQNQAEIVQLLQEQHKARAAQSKPGRKLPHPSVPHSEGHQKQQQQHAAVIPYHDPAGGPQEQEFAVTLTKTNGKLGELSSLPLPLLPPGSLPLLPAGCREGSGVGGALEDAQYMTANAQPGCNCDCRCRTAAGRGTGIQHPQCVRWANRAGKWLPLTAAFGT